MALHKMARCCCKCHWLPAALCKVDSYTVSRTISSRERHSCSKTCLVRGPRSSVAKSGNTKTMTHRTSPQHVLHLQVAIAMPTVCDMGSLLFNFTPWRY